MVEKNYLNKAAIIVVYDISDRNSFNNVYYWLNEIEEIIKTNYNNCIYYIVGNKSDLLASSGKK